MVASTPARPARSANASSISAELSTPITRLAREASGSEAAPAPHPTSRTDPPSGSASNAVRFETVSAVPAASSARLANSATGKCHGETGARSRISLGMAHSASASRHRAAAVATASPP